MSDRSRPLTNPISVAHPVVEVGEDLVTRTPPTPPRGTASVNAVAARHARGELTSAEAVAAVDPHELERALTLTADTSGLDAVVHGLGVAPGIACGPLVFSTEAAVAARADGLEPVLVLSESRPDDLPGLLAATAVVTERGGRTTHSAVVARALGRPSVAGLVDGVVIDDAELLRGARGDVLVAGDVVTVDGSGGTVFRGRPAEPLAGGHGNTEILRWLDTALADLPGLAVKVNADSAEAAARGRELGATGVGLFRVEHVFLGDRRALLERVLIARPGPEMTEGLADVYSVLRSEFVDLLRVVDGQDVAIRLLDPPRHEFLPDPASAAADGVRAVLAKLREHNPMLGVRGVRLGILVPALTVAQIQALVDAVLEVRRSGHDPRPELLVPMVSTPAEVDVVRGLLDDVRAHAGTTAEELPIAIGAMVETPRAALLAGRLAERVDALSLGTNDLTALVWGLSRDDADRHLLPAYRDLGVVEHSPFERLDLEGVGAVIRQVVRDARRVRPGIRIGVCGEQAAEASAVEFLADAGVDYISCAAPRVPLARLAAARHGLPPRNPEEGP
ncbi:putative PEP-binding protein [Umezawaea endophytica]|uniref:Pyruvate, phosphate dikinase n=1 Tax=Umezawaea endophytica TaxID=1654476 RepID=A0A9X2ZXN4_9PSEU|nr:putative PEP-binding protein [Umezawaea endophytica]MCS7475544.1 PEP-utilizing enzyme [Umezawaea endophytica]